MDITAAFSARRAPPTCAGWCCPTRRACRKRMRAKRTGCTTRGTTPRCRSTASRTRFARCRSCRPLRSTNRSRSSMASTSSSSTPGHLLGSAFVRMTIKGGPTVLFGGDLGRYARPVLPDPSPPPRGRCSAARVDLRRSDSRSPTIRARASRRSSRTPSREAAR